MKEKNLRPSQQPGTRIYVAGAQVTSRPAKPRQGEKRLARKEDRVRAAGMARLFNEGKVTGDDLARALQVFAVRGTFDGDWPGQDALKKEVCDFYEVSESWTLEPSAEEKARLKRIGIWQRYDVLRACRARNVSHEEAIDMIVDEGIFDSKRYDTLRSERLTHIDWNSFQADLKIELDSIPMPTNKVESLYYSRRIESVRHECAKRHGIEEIQEKINTECRREISRDTVLRALKAGGRTGRNVNAK